MRTRIRRTVLGKVKHEKIEHLRGLLRAPEEGIYALNEIVMKDRISHLDRIGQEIWSGIYDQIVHQGGLR